MPTQSQIEFFARWNDAARVEDRVADAALTVSQRMEEAVRLSSLVSGLRDAIELIDRDVRPS